MKPLTNGCYTPPALPRAALQKPEKDNGFSLREAIGRIDPRKFILWCVIAPAMAIGEVYVLVTVFG